MSFEPGTKIGEFQLIREIGRGAMGEVYLAEQPSLRRNVALKILNPGLASDPGLIERFKREALNAGRLRHGAIVPVFAAGDHSGTLYIAMDYIEGRSLDRVLREMKDREVQPAPDLIASFLRIGIEISEALHYSHEEGMLHRDIKPSNILLDKRGRPYVGDFGLARHRFDSPLTISGDMIGTPRYMAPEMLDAKIGPIDRRVDIYSLAATLYELTTLHPPFEGEGLQELFSRISSGISDPASRRNPAVPESLSDILDRALARNPADRFQSARQFADALRSVLQQDLAQFTSDSNFAALLGSMRIESVETPKPGAKPQKTYESPIPAELSTDHFSSRWVKRLPGGSKRVSVIAVILAFVWVQGVQDSRSINRELIFGAYPFAFLALINSVPWRLPKGNRFWTTVIWGAAWLICIEIFSGGLRRIGMIGAIAAILMVGSHFLLDRWIHSGERRWLVGMSVAFSVGVALYASLASSPFLTAALNLTGPLALFCATSALLVIPEMFWPHQETELKDPLYRATLLGAPVGLLYFLIIFLMQATGTTR